MLLLGATVTVARAACEGPPVEIRRLAPNHWLVPARVGSDPPAAHRGQVSHLVLAFDGRRTWLIGSGPTPAFGARLACTLKARFGRVVTDLVSPWPHPELVLGAAAFASARHWAHADVADAMQRRCPGCVERLRQRLGDAAVDLGADPVRLPPHRLAGERGGLGPWLWWRLSRGDGQPVTVWHDRRSALGFAPGLLWGDGAPAGGDADLDVLAASTAALADRAEAVGAPRLWIGEQGPPMSAADVRRHADYWQWLLEAAHASVEGGDDETRMPEAPPALALTAGSPQHALNWQRARRQAESRWFQRSLR